MRERVYVSLFPKSSLGNDPDFSVSVVCMCSREIEGMSFL